MATTLIRDIYHTVRGRRVIGDLTWWYLGLSLSIIVVLVAVFVSLADEVIEGETVGIDGAILRWFSTFHSPPLDTFISIATDSGGVVGVTVLTAIAVGLLYFARKRHAMWQLLLGVIGAVVINLVLKAIFMRERPDLWEHIVLETSYSFPSGHAMASSALAASVVLILWHTKWRWWAVSVAILYTLFVGASRMYLGVHYPSDVVGAWVVSLAWVAIVALLIGTLRPPKQLAKHP